MTADGTPLIGYNGNQQLLLGLTLDYRHNSADFGSSGSVKNDTYTLTGSARYTINTFYVEANAAFDWRRTSLTDNVNSGTGSTGGSGYNIGGTIGQLFPLYNTSGLSPGTAIPTKAPPLNTTGGYGVFLNLEGMANYRNELNDSFIETSGFSYGSEQLSYTDLGARVRLIGMIPSGELRWMPYVGVTFDQLVGFNNALNIPGQAATAADTFYFGQSNTFWGAQGGLKILSRTGITADITGFYNFTADANIAGGSVALRIPLGMLLPVPDAGIREARW